MITRLSGADAVSLNTQTSTTPAHALIIIEASERVSHDRLHQLVASSLPRLARFRSRLVDKPLGMGQPVWAEIDDYALERLAAFVGKRHKRSRRWGMRKVTCASPDNLGLITLCGTVVAPNHESR